MGAWVSGWVRGWVGGCLVDKYFNSSLLNFIFLYFNGIFYLSIVHFS